MTHEDEQEAMALAQAEQDYYEAQQADHDRAMAELEKENNRAQWLDEMEANYKLELDAVNIVRRLVDYAINCEETSGRPAWSVIEEVTLHGSGVSKAIIEKYKPGAA